MQAGPWNRLQKKLAGRAVEQFYENLSYWGRKHPRARMSRHGVEVVDNIAYQAPGDKAHLLDVYRPESRDEPLPVIFYVHGGGFRILSKDTHWVFGLGFARRGYVVFNINYRLAPAFRYPAAMEDVAAAYQWVVEHAASYGGDPSRIVLAGESAGANLVTSLALATCSKRSEAWARPLVESCPPPVAVMPSCGLHQVSDPERFERRRKLPRIVTQQLHHIAHDYLPEGGSATGEVSLANPLLAIEAGPRLARPLPPFFLTVGTRDPILDDTRRLDAALLACDVPCQTNYYPGEGHAFQALVWRPAAQRWWHDSLHFLETTTRLESSLESQLAGDSAPG